ncbi:Acylphosphatase [Franzmannia pantelleriensis]|uniref:Acylphosphatase n=2 Tax=Franzmannia pantelleriensis TaxID=48727 RepID=A0A1G9VPA7_9GAMM|nr:Acylphosphatase [Halomonas pantelleriensis]
MGRRQKAINGHQLELKRPQSGEVARLAANIRQLIKMQRHELAVEVLLQLQRLDPGHAEALLLQGELELEAGDMTKALHSLLAASYQLPSYPRVFWLLAKLHAMGRQDLAAISALLRYVELRPTESKGMMTLSALYTEAGLNEQAEYWVRRGLRLEPFRCEKKIPDNQRKMRVLVLMTAESSEWRINRKTFQAQIMEGHNNLSLLLDAAHIEVWTLFVDTISSAPEVARKLPKLDLVYNAITDAERCAEALAHAHRLCDRLCVPVVNAPLEVLAASREGNHDRLMGAQGVIVPKSIKLEHVQGDCRALVEDAVKKESLTFPLIVRLAGYQGGKYMHLVQEPASHDYKELDAALAQQPQTLYLIEYHDVSYQDARCPDIRLFPKYRAFMVGSNLYPCHLFTGDSFNVHLKSAEKIMQANPWLVDLERAYCHDPARHLGESNWAALSEAMQALGLDYCGVDFSPSADDPSKLVIFEMNPAMRNWVSHLPEGDHVQLSWKTITRKVHEHFCFLTDISPWHFNLPEGTAPVFSEDDILTLRLLISGQVQGVGYHQWFASQLVERGIAGWVRNSSDGSVEAVIHGKLGDLQPLCDEVPNGPEGASVSGFDAKPWDGAIPKGVEIR